MLYFSRHAFEHTSTQNTKKKRQYIQPWNVWLFYFSFISIVRAL